MLGNAVYTTAFNFFLIKENYALWCELSTGKHALPAYKEHPLIMTMHI